MALRKDDTCTDCGIELPAGTKAYWFKPEGVVRCVHCVVPTEDSEPRPGVGVHTPAEPDVAGASARAKHDRDAARERGRQEERVAADKERRRQRAERGFLGKVVNAVTPAVTIGPESQSVKAWDTGATGEERVGEWLDKVTGIEVLHDRLKPGAKSANIDHITVGPSGVYVIDAKNMTGAVDVRDKGKWLRADERLYVGGRDRTSLVDGVLGQVDLVRVVLGEEYETVPVVGVLCFVEADWPIIRRYQKIRGVVTLWPRKLVEVVSAPGPHEALVVPIAEKLRSNLRRAR